METKINPFLLEVYYENNFPAHIVIIPNCQDLKSMQTRERDTNFVANIASSLSSYKSVESGISLIL